LVFLRIEAVAVAVAVLDRNLEMGWVASVAVAAQAATAMAQPTMA
jgi:hypothetical protein